MKGVVLGQKLEGVCNFRDLGGLENRHGQTVRHGLIFRSDELSRLGEGDLRFLSEIPLRTIVDLRTDREIARCPSRRPASLRTMALCTLDTPRCLTEVAGTHDDAVLDRIDRKVRDMLGNTDAKLGTLPEDEVRRATVRLYERMTTEPDFLAVYRRIFDLLLQEESVPLLFHCMAGKDRTGMVAALILSALDVDEETILEDYLLSNVVAEKKYAKQIAMNPVLRYLYRAYPEFLEAAFAKIRSDHGSVQKYLQSVLGIDTRRMKDRYLV